MEIRSLLELYRYSADMIYIQIAVIVIAFVISAFFIRRPKKVLEMDMAFYRPFNWKVEPISMEKAIRKTRKMGITIFMVGLISLVGILLLYANT